MSEKNPATSNDALLESRLKEFREQMAAGQELQRQDKEDPVRGPIVRSVRQFVLEASKRSMEENSPYTELASFRNAFMEHFGNDTARRYRLFHVIIGSTPPATSDLFDAEGEWSIATKMDELAQKYQISEEDAAAA